MDSFEVKFSQAGESLQCDVNVPNKGTKITSLVIGLSLKDFLRHASSPDYLFCRFLQMDKKTLRVAYTGGLKAGGSCCSSRPTEIPLAKNPQESLDTNDNPVLAKRLKDEKKSPNHIAKSVANPMSFGTMDNQSLHKLKNLCPYNCHMPQNIIKLLLESCKDNEFWTSVLYLDDRSFITQIIRRHLLVSIMKYPDAEDFDKNTIAGAKKNLEEIRKRVELSMDYPELGTVIDLTTIINLLSERKYIASRWKLLTNACPALECVINGPRRVITPSIISSVFNYYSTLPPHAPCIDLVLELEIMETLIKASNEECREIIEAFIAQVPVSLPTLAWEQMHLLLDLVTACITYGKVATHFALHILNTLEQLASHETWQIRQKCASALRLLRNNQDQEVRAKAQKIHHSMRSEEIINGHQGILNILRFMPLKIDEKYQQKECIHNLDNTRRIVGRKNEMRELENIFKSRNLVALVGEGGIGKSSVATKYAQEMQFSCKIVWQINSESKCTLLQGLTCLAEKLGVEMENNKDALKEMMAKLSTFKDPMLIVFDNCANQAQINQYCVENPRIKYMVTSRSNEWDTIMQIKQFSPDESLAYLQSLVRNFNEKEQMRILVQKLKHSPLLILQSACIINSKKLTVKKFSSAVEKDLNKSDTIQRLFSQVFAKLEMKTLSILELLSQCDSQAIPEAMIRKLFLKTYKKKDWWASRSSLVNCYGISVEGELWNVHRVLHLYIRDHHHLKQAKPFADYYSKKFIITDSVWSDKKSLQKIRNLKPHVSEFLTGIQEYTVKEAQILDNAAKYSFRIDIDFEEATRILDKLTVIVHNGTFQPLDLAELNRRLGFLYSDKAEYLKSEEFFMKCLKIREEILPPIHPDIAALYMDLGNLSRNQTSYSKSLACYMKCLKIQQEILPSNHPEIAALYMDLAILYRDIKDYDHSIEFYMKCMEIYEETLPQNHPNKSTLYMDLANLYRLTGRYDMSENFYTVCLMILGEVLPPNHPDIAALYLNLASLSSDNKNENKAIDYYIK